MRAFSISPLSRKRSSIAFNTTSQWLAVSSDKGTVHIFALKTKDGDEPPVRAAAASGAAAEPAAAAGGAAAAAAAAEDDAAAVNKDEKPANPTSALSFFKALLPKYFASEWSFAQYRVPDVRTLVAFGAEKHSIVGTSCATQFLFVVSSSRRHMTIPPSPSSLGRVRCLYSH
jgi:hypothetical protein